MLKTWIKNTLNLLARLIVIEVASLTWKTADLLIATGNRLCAVISNLEKSDWNVRMDIRLRVEKEIVQYRPIYPGRRR